MSRRAYLRLWLGTILFLLVVLCGVYVHTVNTWESWSPTDYPLEQADRILEAIATFPTKPPPTYFPFGMLYGVEQCWDVLQAPMLRNGYNYTIHDVWSIGYRPTSVVIILAFTDGTRVQMDFYNSTLELCTELMGSE